MNLAISRQGTKPLLEFRAHFGSIWANFGSQMEPRIDPKIAQESISAPKDRFTQLPRRRDTTQHSSRSEFPQLQTRREFTQLPWREFTQLD